jgi:hypothetical protein
VKWILAQLLFSILPMSFAVAEIDMQKRYSVAIATNIKDIANREAAKTDLGAVNGATSEQLIKYCRETLDICFDISSKERNAICQSAYGGDLAGAIESYMKKQRPPLDKPSKSTSASRCFPPAPQLKPKTSSGGAS